MTVLHGTSRMDASPVPGYELMQSLNSGGMGRVHVARQHALNRLVCVKIMSIPDGEDADSCRARFCREAELLASVSHPHILSIFDFGTTVDQGLPFLVTEYIEGGDLRGRMKADQAMPIGQARKILRQVADALSHLHAKGILHRDLKPENILLPTETMVKVGDFGLAVMREHAGALTEPTRGMGTVGYVAPEQQYGLKVDERSDQYSLAALSYELLTGRRPLGLFAPPSAFNPRVSTDLDAVILRGLADEPKNRYASIGRYMEALDEALKSAAETTNQARRSGSAVILIALVGAAGLWWGAAGGRKPPAGREATAPGRDGTLEKAPAPLSAPPRGTGRDAPATPRHAHSAEMQKLITLRAYAIWVGQGRPEGEAGARAKQANWDDATRQIEAAVRERAFKIWESQGRPTGQAGDAVYDQNMRTAEAELLKETNEDLIRHPLD